jgi:nitrate reductase gamma subunit
LAIVMGLALIGARRAIDRRTASPSTPLDPMRRTALWLTAAANVAVVVSILTSLYHAHTTWIVVGLLLAAGLSLVAVACVRAARQ